MSSHDLYVVLFSGAGECSECPAGKQCKEGGAGGGIKATTPCPKGYYCLRGKVHTTL